MITRQRPNSRPCWICGKQPSYAHSEHGIVCRVCKAKLEGGKLYQDLLVVAVEREEPDSDIEAAD